MSTKEVSVDTSVSLLNQVIQLLKITPKFNLLLFPGFFGVQSIDLCFIEMVETVFVNDLDFIFKFKSLLGHLGVGTDDLLRLFDHLYLINHR